MKVKFRFDIGVPVSMNTLNWSKEDKDEYLELNTSINYKIESTIVDIPCVPTKEMLIDLLTFEKEFNLTENEIEFISLNVGGNYSIYQIVITPTYLELILE